MPEARSRCTCGRSLMDRMNGFRRFSSVHVAEDTLRMFTGILTVPCASLAIPSKVSRSISPMTRTSTSWGAAPGSPLKRAAQDP